TLARATRCTTRPAVCHRAVDWPDGVVRFVASWDNTSQDVETLVAVAAAACDRLPAHRSSSRGGGRRRTTQVGLGFPFLTAAQPASAPRAAWGGCPGRWGPGSRVLHDALHCRAAVVGMLRCVIDAIRLPEEWESGRIASKAHLSTSAPLSEPRYQARYPA